MKRCFTNLGWLLLALAGAWSYVVLAFHRGEQINSVFILIAALCTYAIGYRFYSRWIAARVLMLDDRRATPCEAHDDGKDFVKTNKWIVFGHHFAAISGPGPLVGPVLAAQFGYLPGTLWILIGVVLGGAVQDFVILFCSLRRDGKSLGQMVKEELNTPAGFIALLAILAIMVILLAVLALVVVKALAESPWGVFTVAATIPIALFMGGYMRFWRVGKVMEASAFGVVMLLLGVWGGKLVYESPYLSQFFGVRDITLAWAIIIYGLAASVLPVWLLLAPRDYLSTFMKLGTIFALAVGIFFVLPDLKMPAVSRFVDGSGLVVAGKVFPFCFITIACGSISGFHTLIASGTTPKLITRESYARQIGYGAMCLESLVAIMAMIAACTLDPGVYLAMNVKGTPDAVVKTVAGSGMTRPMIEVASPHGTFTVLPSEAKALLDKLEPDEKQNYSFGGYQAPVTVSKDQMDALAKAVGEKSLYGRTGGAATLAVGMAQIFSKAVNGRWLDLWYHFAIMFEALFILTTIDAGTRVGRYILQDFLGSLWKPLGDTRKLGANLVASGLMVCGWGYFLIQGVRDPLGGINSLWPLFGIANQMLAAIALCLATTIILKMQLGASRAEGRESAAGRPALAMIALVPLIWLVAVTFTAGMEKIWHPDPRIGFLSQARQLRQQVDIIEEMEPGLVTQISDPEAATRLARRELPKLRIQVFNNQLDAAVAGIFLALVAAIVCLSVREWVLLLSRRKSAVLRETKPVWLPDFAVAEGGRNFSGAAGTAALALALAREISGEAQLERAQDQAAMCECSEMAPGHFAANDHAQGRRFRQHIYLEVTEQRFRGVKRCC